MVRKRTTLLLAFNVSALTLVWFQLGLHNISEMATCCFVAFKMKIPTVCTPACQVWDGGVCVCGRLNQK